MRALNFIGPLVVLVLVVTIAAVVIANVSGRRGAPAQPGIGSVRRVYFYGLAVVALFLAASGVNLLVAQLLEELVTPAIAGQRSTPVAIGLAATLVGAPVWLLFWRAAQRSLLTYPGEAGTTGRRLYVNGVLAVSAAVAAVAGTRLVNDALDGDWNVSALTTVLVWGGVWVFHASVERTEGQPTDEARTLRRLYLYGTSAYALGMLVFGSGAVVAAMLRAGYDAVFTAGSIAGTPARALWTAGVREALAASIVGGTWWWWHWHRLSRGDTGSTLRQVVVYVLGAVGGMAIMVAAASTVLYMALGWLLARPEEVAAVTHFSVVASALGWGGAGAGLWGYHAAVASQESAGAGAAWHTGGERTYRYLLAAVGLGTLSVGLVVLIGAVLATFGPDGAVVVSDTRGGAGLALGITLLAVGAPLWAMHWRRQQALARGVGDPGTTERESAARRVFLFVVFGIAVLATIGTLSAFLFTFFRDLLEGDLSAGVVQDGRLQLGTVLMAGAVSVYHWLVLRDDRAAAASVPARVTRAPRRIVVLAHAGSAVAEALERRLGVTVERWERMDGPLPASPDEEALDALADSLRATAAEAALVVVDADATQVLPYRVR